MTANEMCLCLTLFEQGVKSCHCPSCSKSFQITRFQDSLVYNIKYLRFIQELWKAKIATYIQLEKKPSQTFVQCKRQYTLRQLNGRLEYRKTFGTIGHLVCFVFLISEQRAVRFIKSSQNCEILQINQNHWALIFQMNSIEAILQILPKHH